MRVLHSKHQKLILQCYPPGKAVDKKPNPLELSYLLYYASTRRVKLEKVIDFLDRKTKSDARGSKSGNLHVTLAIVAALIDKCADNLNAFALQVCSILQSVLNTGELPLCKSVVATYRVFCEKLDGGLFSGDKAFVAAFTALTDLLLNVGQTKLAETSPNQREWLMTALLTARHAFNCLGFNANISKRFIGMCVPLLTQTVRLYSLHDALLTHLHSNLNVEKDERRMSRVATTAARLTAVDEDSLSQSDLNEEALRGLKALFNTSLLSQISEATAAVVENNYRAAVGASAPKLSGPKPSGSKAPATEDSVSNWPPEGALSVSSSDETWAVTFLEMCASWIPVQLRFVALLTLLHRITAISDRSPTDKTTYPLMVHFAGSILGLVSLDFNMIGLSITDILQQLLTLQTNLYLVQADKFAPEQVSHLSDLFSQSMCSLSSHIYYFDQVLDLIVAILFQIDSTMMSAAPAKVSAVHTLVVSLLNTVSTILRLLTRKMSTISRNHATLDNWELSFSLLSIPKSYKDFAAAANPEMIADIQSKYLTVFNEFLDTEMVPADDQAEDSAEPGQPTAGKLLEPNYNAYIDNADNALAHLLVHCNDFFSDQAVNLYVARMLVDMLRNLLAITGINFVHNFLPFFLHWQLLEATKNLPECARDTSAYLLLTELLAVLGSKYPDSVHVDVTKLLLYKDIQEDVDDRRNRAVWVDELDGTISTGTMTAGESLTNKVNKKSLYEFFAQTSWQKWLSTQRTFHPDNNGTVAVVEGNLANLFNTDQPQLSDDHLDDSRSSVPAGAPNGYGLGTANDISSIHSGLLHGNCKPNGLVSADATQLTVETLPSIGSHFVYETNNYKHLLMPRVSDLKRSVSGSLVQDDLFSFTNERNTNTPRSVLQRQIVTTDVQSILNNLTSEDDSEIVV